ncbi:WhiB family transcriptional regulator [Propionibacteriaceae bacterium Y1700]|uniref:WhiB family transcriptional regulator n=1 Tax=Microlunatus sp. Y1700 TaxID=3418487 RepID=UPI003DA75363
MADLTDWLNNIPELDGARCVEVGHDVFFPGQGENDLVRQARAICAQCPAAAACLAHYINETDGIYAGTTGRQRAAMRRHTRKEQTSGRY